MKYDIVIVSGYFNPLHIGHIEYMMAARDLGKRLVVIVNNDNQVKLKGSKPFMNQSERLKIVKSLRGVDAAVLSIDEDKTVCETLKRIANVYKTPQVIFATGADHDAVNTWAERLVCMRSGIAIAYGVGGSKIQSSSKLLQGVK